MNEITSRDTLNLQLGEWLKQLGCPVPLTPDQLRRLNPPSMRSIWRHLQSHVMPTRSVQIVKRNLLLEKLEKINILPGQFGSFKIESVQELSQLQNISAVQEEVNNLKAQDKKSDATLRTMTYNYLTKLTQKENLRYKIKEIENKTTLLNYMLFRVQKNTNKLEETLDTASCLKIRPTSTSHQELNFEKSVVAKCMADLKCSSDGSMDIKSSYHLIETTSELSVSAIYEGFLIASGQVLKSLNRCKTSLDYSTNPSKSKENLGFRQHFRNLNLLIIQNEQDLHKCFKKVEEYSSIIDKERTKLKKNLADICTNNQCYIDEESESVDKLIDTLVKNAQMSKTLNMLSESKADTWAECSKSKHSKDLIIKLGEKEKDLNLRIKRTVSDIGKLLTLAHSNKITNKKAQVLQYCVERSSNFISDMKIKGNESEDIFMASENIIVNEVEMFGKTPLAAITRQWEGCEVLPKDILSNISKDSSLLCFLLQSEPKDILKSVFEKMCWTWNHGCEYS